MKTKNTLDNAISNKIQPEQLKDNIFQEKELLIRELKEKLDKARQDEQHLVDRLYILEKQNKELAYIKENFDNHIERLNRRISELSENQQNQQNYVKFSNDNKQSQQSALKKTVAKR
ncbi:hypothetical protein IMG5_198830 [Ichthyophthirius multifiliis]|uniref:Uncharacterized protein n=1 Tax=Ichthyophthirius multifiliis TaxID=5932 RepID=G0R5G9_ICHMU|nr:hypothetical protein IMG5_198830 [Ichthyophthirius multifiliis]EGR27291.1 hypothetical protein IMG5_198830 [Ichthyophthirius multifiliis]|eukprot:XP_004024175.1 hypothetical protein IMG5_198830 [Ichthyophthirius multifiliis]